MNKKKLKKNESSKKCRKKQTKKVKRNREILGLLPLGSPIKDIALIRFIEYVIVLEFRRELIFHFIMHVLVNYGVFYA